MATVAKDIWERESRKYEGISLVRNIYQLIPTGYHDIHAIIWKDRNKNM